jgi:hypothetical protein
VKVCADNYNQVKETDEQNNCLEKTCECVVDIIPPRITSGTTVSQITQTSVLICWETDEVSDSLVKYDSRSGKYGSVIEDSELVKEHCLTLTNLEPATTYHFVVESADSGGNKMRSRDLNFETALPPDEEKPSLALLVPDKLSGRVTISADVQDNTGVDRVVFLLDGEPIHTDYAFPFEWHCDSGILDEGLHNFGAKAFDAVGNMIEDSRDAIVQNRFPAEFSPVHVRILNPERRAGVYGEVPIGVEVTHDLNDGIKSITVKVDGEIICEKPYSKGYYMEMGPGLEPIWVVTGYPKPPVYETCDWDAGIEGDGTHVIEVSTEDGHENWGNAGIEVRFSRPELSVSRLVARDGNYFRVTLVIENTGEIDVEDLTVSDTSAGFQCLKTGWMLKKPSGGDWRGGHPIEYEVSTTSSGSSSTISTGDLGTLRPNEAIKLQYYAVPALGGGFVVGSELEVTYRAGGRGFTDYPLRGWFVSSEEINRAFLDTDYVIVTTPEALFIHYDHDEVNELLSTMAELAKEKNGVLGYLPSSTSAHTLKGLIVPGGAWYERLVGSEGGGAFDYLLIVGETEIVPSFYPATNMFHDPAHPEKSHTHGDIDCSDYLYADIHGNDLIPELRVGRIVGDHAGALIRPIRASINVHNHVPGHEFDRSDALLESGGEADWEQFVDKTNQIGAILASYGTTTDYVRREYYTTEVNLLREALFILGTQWECDPHPKEFPDELEHLRPLTCIYDCMGELEGSPPRHVTKRDEHGHPTEYCPMTHPPMDLPSLYGIISMDDAILVQEVRRDGPVSQTYDYNFPRPDGTTAWNFIVDQIKSEMPNKDIYYWNGHGNSGTWSWFDSNDFGRSHPVVFSNSCLTGAYENTYGAPESSFKAGAAVFIGATEVSIADSEHGFEFARKFFEEYWLPGTSCGDALTELKRWMWITADEGWHYTAYEYNLYGDPKFGE